MLVELLELLPPAEACQVTLHLDPANQAAALAGISTAMAARALTWMDLPAFAKVACSADDSQLTVRPTSDHHQGEFTTPSG
eukprot:1352173-Pyramimonas_sp.AAC.1